MYSRGDGVVQDYSQALKWYRKAAGQGLARAQYNLGWMYEKGQGVAQDDVQAYMWFNLAAAQRDEGAAEHRDKLAQSMTPDQVAEAQILAREWTEKHPK